MTTTVHLGESEAASDGTAMVGPTIGTITVTDTTPDVQTLSAGAATGGTFRLKYKGVETADLAYNVSDADLLAALQGLESPVGADFTNATVASFVITFGGEVGPAEVITVSDDSTTGGTAGANVTVTHTTTGVLGSASAAYTEEATIGASVLTGAVLDSSGEEFGTVVDAASPVVFSSLKPGAYHMVARTVDTVGRVSVAVTKAFTVA